MGDADKRGGLAVGALALVLLAAMALSFSLGRYPIPPKELGGMLLGRVLPIAPFWTERMEAVLWGVRLPRILLAAMVGCSLSGAGAAYQGVFQNPMASPDILGASAGAAFGAALGILLGLGGRMVTWSAFLFGLATVGLVWLIGRFAKGNRVLGLILSGIMVSSLFQAATSYLKLVADPASQLPQITYWLMGSLSGAKMGDVVHSMLPMGLGAAALIALRWKVNLLTLGDDEARTMGVNAGALRLAVTGAATLLTAASIAVSGTIGWVGLVVPHLARRIVGSNFRRLMPASMLLGATFLLLVDDVSRNLLATEIPLGILTAFVGAPFFLWLIVRREEG